MKNRKKTLEIPPMKQYIMLRRPGRPIEEQDWIMDEEKKENSAMPENNEEFTRTVIVERPSLKKRGNQPTPLRRIISPFMPKTQELEDLVGGVDVSDYTNEVPDTSAELTTPLRALDTRYTVLEEFAQGGNATVSIARDKNLRRVVAVKSLKEESKTRDDMVKAFVSEARVTAQLDHPSIIPVYGLTGDEKSGIQLIMKLVNGRTLREYLRNTALNYKVRGIKTFDEEALMRKRLEIFLRVCDAIAYAHHRNIMHRDLKPENIMLGEFMEVFVMDWGLAKEIPPEGQKKDEKERIAGTPRYFAPEILRGDRGDARADIFTLGLILQEIVTLRFAVQGRDEKELMERILSGELEPVEHRFGWKIDKTLKAIIRKATAYRVEDRYQSVSELSEDLRRYMNGLSTSALPDDFLMRITRFSYRHRKGFMIIFMALLFASAALTAVAIHRQLRTSQEMGLQRRATNFIYNRTVLVAEHLDITALHIQEQLSALSRIAAYLLSCNTEGKASDSLQAFHPPIKKDAKPDLGVAWSPYYKRLIGMDFGIYTTAPGADDSLCREFMRKVSPALTKMKHIVLESKNSKLTKENYEKLKSEYLFQGLPIRSVFIGSRCGVKLLYPWRGNYSRDIDPRQRSWYRNALRKTGPVWGKPYMDIDSVSGLSIPCSIQICDLHGRFRGVAGLDLSVNRLTDSILARGNTGDYVIEKAVIDRGGETIFSTKSEYFNRTFDPDKYHQDAAFATPLFREPDIRNRILKAGRDFGIFSVVTKGKKTVYSFARLKILDMYYVVVADYGKLLAHVCKLDR